MRPFVAPLLLACLLATPALAAPSGVVKDLRKHAARLGAVRGVVEGDDPRLTKAAELIEAVAKEGSADAAKTLLALTRAPFPSPSVEVTLAELSRDALATMEGKEARAVVYKALKKAIKRPAAALPLAEVVGGWPTAESAAALAPLLLSRDERAVKAAARALGQIHLKESVGPLVDAFVTWQKRGGDPVEVIGRALYDATGQPLTKAADWRKWWGEVGKTWTADMRPKVADGDGTKTRPNHFQTGENPKFFESLEVKSRRIVLVMDVSGSMHIREYVKDPGEEGEKGAGTSLGAPVPSEDPDAEGYTPKKCTFHQCPAARGRKGATCPSDEKLPAYYSRMNRLTRAAQKLVRVLPKGTKFNMVAYSTEARTWKGKALIAASGSNKDKACKWLESLSEGGVTRSNTAVDLAMTFLQADTIIFVTDGAPTSAAGKPLDEKQVTEFLAEIKRKNRTRKVKIDVIAIGEGSTDFASELAEQNEGQYLGVD
ncbi:MAG: hypothetical protein JKY65_32745 [Planctomycetes bacterium]|nr:hypothetical protein [Planctomycetota bacterium]